MRREQHPSRDAPYGQVLLLPHGGEAAREVSAHATRGGRASKKTKCRKTGPHQNIFLLHAWDHRRFRTQVYVFSCGLPRPFLPSVGALEVYSHARRGGRASKNTKCRKTGPPKHCSTARFGPSAFSYTGVRFFTSTFRYFSFFGGRAPRVRSSTRKTRKTPTCMVFGYLHPSDHVTMRLLAPIRIFHVRYM